MSIIPEVTTEKFAQIHHGYQYNCSSFPSDNEKEKPKECTYGARDAQQAAAYSSGVAHFFNFMTGSLIGEFSDIKGRRMLIILGVFLEIFPSFLLVLMQCCKSIDPTWYYIAVSSSNIVSWFTIILASIVDVTPNVLRASSIGLIMSSFQLGFMFSPFLPLVFGHLGASIFSCSIVIFMFLFVTTCLEETLPKNDSNQKEKSQIIITEGEKSRTTISEAQEESPTQHNNSTRTTYNICEVFLRPFRSLAILNRDKFFRILSSIAFLGSMTYTGVETLLVYDFENRLGFDDLDIGLFFLLMGLCGISFQVFAFQPLQNIFGERILLMISKLSSVVRYLFYGFTRSKILIFLSTFLSAPQTASFPLVSAIKSNNVKDTEQGHVQGALFALTSLSGALGPIIMQKISYLTRDSSFGYMYIFIASLMVVSVFLVLMLPEERTNSSKLNERNIGNLNSDDVEDNVDQDDDSILEGGDLREPLLSG
eukprot:CAMPEP_0178949946 /NCGR_PEP_ID=MMETSP0789-20121207/6355_1 /TAXON_ID=3005 /ORGANISM="Rhizosolenia setigera, Strain CCMP 1694" /LENGTH=479 /DNA_ID=CAMNT_0020630569 /DNA_START=52 /DNA_END=1491 /DNA_ORIENTATION=-